MLDTTMKCSWGWKRRFAVAVICCLLAGCGKEAPEPQAAIREPAQPVQETAEAESAEEQPQTEQAAEDETAKTADAVSAKATETPVEQAKQPETAAAQPVVQEQPVVQDAVTLLKQELQLHKERIEKDCQELQINRLDRRQGFGQKVDELIEERTAGNRAMDDGDYATTKNCYQRADVIVAWLKENQPQREAVAKKLEEMRLRERELLQKDIKRYALVSFTMTCNLLREAQRTYDDGQFAAAAKRLEACQEGFDNAAMEMRKARMQTWQKEARIAANQGTKEGWETVLKLSEEMSIVDETVGKEWRERARKHLIEPAAVVEKPAEPAAAAVVEKPAEPAAAAVVEKPAAKVAEPVEKPAEPTAVAVVEKPAAKVTEPVEKPADKAMAVAVVEKPAAKVAEPVEKPADKAMAVAAVVEKPAAKVAEPVEKPADKAMAAAAVVEKPAAKVTEPVEKPADKAMAVAVVEKPAEPAAAGEKRVEKVADSAKSSVEHVPVKIVKDAEKKAVEPQEVDGEKNDDSIDEIIQAEEAMNDFTTIIEVKKPAKKGVEKKSEAETKDVRVSAVAVGVTKENFVLPGGCELRMVKITAGTFTMGSPKTEKSHERNEMSHEVTLTKDYWIGETEVTQAQWKAVGIEKKKACHWTGEQLPVECVSWQEAMAFCKKLNELLADKLPAGYQFSLPTEAQWEYACRGGENKHVPFSFGEVLDGRQANCDGTCPYGTAEAGVSLGHTAPVRQYPPNAWGLYDMHGNVWEWCLDCSDFDYELYTNTYIGKITDPLCSIGSFRMRRGGSWNNFAVHCRTASRNSREADCRDGETGFRVVLTSVMK